MTSTHSPVLPKEIRQVLFVCTGNSCRSVMAEAFFRKMAKDAGLDVQTASAGTSTFAGIGASAETIRVMRAEGIDVSGHRGQKITTALVEGSDIVLVMHQNHMDYLRDTYPEATDKVFLLSEFYSGEDKHHFTHGIPDPIGMNNVFYKNVMDVIRRSLESLIHKMGGKNT